MMVQMSNGEAMPKLKIEDLAKIKKKFKESFALQQKEGKVRVNVHLGTCSIAAGAREIMGALLQEIEKSDAKNVVVITSGCAGLCSREPMITVELPGAPPVKYSNLTHDKMRKIFSEHILGGKIVQDYALAIGCDTTA
jgi:NADP-reducing hydrogenase subunit HndB